MKEFELWYEPRIKALDQMKNEMDKKSEMSEFDTAYLCGLIRERNPHKIVEVGVAAGGTTGIVLQCLDMLDGGRKEFYSVDLNEFFYRDIANGREQARRTGFLAEPLIERTAETVDHQFLLGAYLPKALEKIGEGIDFLILDTVHTLPGEILDYLAAFPFLSADAVVVLHDTAHHVYADRGGVGTVCGKSNHLLLSVVTADKYWKKDDGIFLISNIGGFRLNEDTRKYIRDVFFLLYTNWEYMPGESELELYKKWYRKYYDISLTEMFEDAVLANRYMAVHGMFKMNALLDQIAKADSFVLYGAGMVGKNLLAALRVQEIFPKAFLVTNQPENGACIEGVPICGIELWKERLLRENVLVIVAVTAKNEDQIMKVLKDMRITNVICVSDYMRNNVENENTLQR